MSEKTIRDWISRRRRIRATEVGSRVGDDAHITQNHCLSALDAVLDLHESQPNTSSALHPKPLCACGETFPCPTRAAIAHELGTRP